MHCIRHFLRTLVLLALASNAVASESAEELLASYQKKDIVELLLKKCYGEVTVNEPFPKRVYGRPPAEQVDARTLAHDMARCKFSAEDGHAFFERRGALRRRPDPARIVGGASGSIGATSGLTSSIGSSSRARGSSSLQQRLREVERKQRERERAEARRKAEGERELERARQAEMTNEQRQQAQRERECTLARERRDFYRGQATRAASVSVRERARKIADDVQEAIRANCKSVL